jgi:hypothetical protein
LKTTILGLSGKQRKHVRKILGDDSGWTIEKTPTGFTALIVQRTNSSSKQSKPLAHTNLYTLLEMVQKSLSYTKPTRGRVVLDNR